MSCVRLRRTPRCSRPSRRYASRRSLSGDEVAILDTRLRGNDTWIAATALVHGAAVWTQDADFGAFHGVEVVRV